MDKGILEQYIDACELVKETEEQIRRLKNNRKTVVVDTVKGSMHDFPFAPKSFKVTGIPMMLSRIRASLTGRNDFWKNGKQLQHRLRARWKPGLIRFWY